MWCVRINIRRHICENLDKIYSKSDRGVIWKREIIYIHCLRFNLKLGNLMLGGHRIRLSLKSLLWHDVIQTWWVRLVRLGLGCWIGDFQKSIIFNIIIWEVNFILMQHTFKKCNNLVKLWVKFIHFSPVYFLLSPIEDCINMNWSSKLDISKTRSFVCFLL